MLRGSNQPDFGLGRFSTTCVIHLGYLRASGLLRVARAAAGAVLCGGARRRAYVHAAGAGYDLLHLVQKDQGNVLMLTEGSERRTRRCRVAGGDGERRRWGGARGEGRCRGSPGSWAPRIDTEWCCEGTTGVREDGNTSAAINFGRGRAHRQWRSWPNSTARASWMWLGLLLRFREVTGEVAWCLRGGAVP
jgi:hypothetical protein